jgi:hypothetical protein
VRIRTDDEIYRVDAVWLGPPKATFPWRARYVAWGIGIAVFLLVLAVERRMNIGFSFFSTAWAVVITVALTRLIGSRISHERPLGAVMVMWLRELTAPRETATGRGGAASAARVRVRSQRPRPKSQRAERPRQRSSGSSGARGSRGQRSAQSQRPRREQRRSDRTRQTAGASQARARRARSKEVRGVRSQARP